MGNDKENMINQFTENYKVPFNTSKDLAWQRLSESIDFDEKAPKANIIWLNWALGTVAAAAIIIGFFFSNLFNLNMMPVEMKTEVGQINPIYLPDNSNVILNSNTTINYKVKNISGERNVTLKGDALFHVKKGKQFIVSFEGGSVKVTGTSFNISAYSKDLMQIDCTEGSVEVAFNGNIFNLKGGEGVKCYKGTITGPYICNPDEVDERVKGIFNWGKVNLSEAFELIGYRFGYKIVIDETLVGRNFSGKVDLSKLEEGLMVISTAMGVDYTINNDQKTIYVDAN